MTVLYSFQSPDELFFSTFICCSDGMDRKGRDASLIRFQFSAFYFFSEFFFVFHAQNEADTMSWKITKTKLGFWMESTQYVLFPSLSVKGEARQPEKHLGPHTNVLKKKNEKRKENKEKKTSQNFCIYPEYRWKFLHRHTQNSVGALEKSDSGLGSILKVSLVSWEMFHKQASKVGFDEVFECHVEDAWLSWEGAMDTKQRISAFEQVTRKKAMETGIQHTVTSGLRCLSTGDSADILLDRCTAEI